MSVLDKDSCGVVGGTSRKVVGFSFLLGISLDIADGIRELGEAKFHVVNVRHPVGSVVESDGVSSWVQLDVDHLFSNSSPSTGIDADGLHLISVDLHCDVAVFARDEGDSHRIFSSILTEDIPPQQVVLGTCPEPTSLETTRAAFIGRVDASFLRLIVLHLLVV